MAHTEQYKQQAEQFVTGFSGTSMWNVFLATTITPAAFFFRSILSDFLPARIESNPWLSLLVDGLVVIFPSLLSITWVEWNLPMLLLFLGLSVCLILYRPALVPTTRASVSEKSPQSLALQGRRKPFISQLKVSLMLGTCLSILAVDFRAFPRSFVKTETFGTSLMDVGVGSFSFMHAITHPPRRQSLGKTLIAMAPLIAIGLARTVAAKSVNYQEHVSEYGTHWNFFLTLATIALFSGLCEPKHPGLLGAAILCGYQVVLSCLGGTDYVMNHPRTNIIHANKEGIWSCVGYFALYLLSAQVGRLLVDDNPSDLKLLVHRWRRKLMYLVLTDVCLWVLTWLADSFVQPVSRRLTNLSYVLWILAMNVFQLSVALAAQLCVKSPKLAVSVEAISRNLLFFFLICNLLTGAVNLSMETIFAPDSVAFAVLIAYISCACAVGLFLHLRGINLKL